MTQTAVMHMTNKLSAGVVVTMLPRISLLVANPIPLMTLAAHKIAIIGAGSVGSTIAYSLLLRRIAGDIILVDIDTRVRHAQALDLSDGAFLSDTTIREGDHKEAGQSDIIIVSAGAKQRDGETRVDLIDRNYSILKSVIEGMKPIRQDAILLLVANPVDVLTYFAQKLSGLPRKQVLGSGTFLDSMRLRVSLAEVVKVRTTKHILLYHLYLM